jgi:UDP-glucose 4-epimerase
MAKRVIVLGSGGLLGSHLVPLLKQQAEVIAPDRAYLDLSRPIDRSALPDRVDAVIYLAQSGRYREFPEGTDDVFRINVEQPLALVDYARRAGATHFLFASSGAVYGTEGVKLTENAPTPAAGEVLGFYGASKLAAEHLLRPYSAYLHIGLLRYFFIYGPGQASGMLIPRVVANVRDRQAITLQGHNGLVINPVHARDAARATIAALDLNSTEAINIAGSEELSLREISEIAGRNLGQEPNWVINDAAKSPALTASIAKMTAMLGAPRVSFEDGLREMIESNRGPR